MLRNQKWWLILLVALLLSFVLGVAHAFRLRFEAGDIYAPYASLRADPLGAKALFDSLKRLPAISLQRHFRPLTQLKSRRGLTLLYLGSSPNDWMKPSENLLRELESIANAGGRVILALSPATKPPKLVGKSDGPKEAEPKLPPDADEAREPFGRKVFLRERWGIALEFEAVPRDAENNFQPLVVQRAVNAAIPETIFWHSGVTLAQFDDSWQSIYSRGDKAVILERKWGLGQIVLSTDSYLFSNEAMRSQRHADLLAWLIGSHSKIVFDEAHLGIQEQPGVVALARSYRLHGFAVGLLILAGLFIWKNAFSFIPPFDDEATEEGPGLVSGKDTAAGFVHLLRRNVSPRQVLGVCFAEWKKSCTHGRVDWQSKVERMQQVVEDENALPPSKRNPVAGYQAMSRILAERK